MVREDKVVFTSRLSFEISGMKEQAAVKAFSASCVFPA
jgi:hypothetical protein